MHSPKNSSLVQVSLFKEKRAFEPASPCGHWLSGTRFLFRALFSFTKEKGASRPAH